jgi:hypothetical protein
MAREKLLKNLRGEYNYHFNWIDETGSVCGFNDVWAHTKREAIKKARAMETEAHWSLYDPEQRKYVAVDAPVNNGNHCFRMKGIYVKVESMYRATRSEADAMNRLGWMMTI